MSKITRSILELNNEEAKKFFLKSESYFNLDLPKYISFEKVLNALSEEIKSETYNCYKAKDHNPLYGWANYQLITNKDGKLAWRPLELIHPVLYLCLVNLLTSKDNWEKIINRFKDFKTEYIECCSIPMVPKAKKKQKPEQILNWWLSFEEQAIESSLDFNHTIQTDVTNCYGSLYTHSISWALHTKEVCKERKNNWEKYKKTKPLLGDLIDQLVRAGRSGQTNGISQGSVVMDFLAELVLGYVDTIISKKLNNEGIENYKILRYRDDYRIFSTSAVCSETILKIIGESLQEVGMRLGASKTFESSSLIQQAIKPDKLVLIGMCDLETSNAKTIQKQLLKLHAFGEKFPNSGALKTMLTKYYGKLVKKKARRVRQEPISVLAAIATDIAITSPQTIPAIAAMLSYFLALVTEEERVGLWERIQKKFKAIPNNSFQEIWLQRIVVPRSVNLPFEGSSELLCEIVYGHNVKIWNNDWIGGQYKEKILKALKSKNIIVENPADCDPVLKLEEIQLFDQYYENSR